MSTHNGNIPGLKIQRVDWCQAGILGLCIAWLLTSRPELEALTVTLEVLKNALGSVWMAHASGVPASPGVIRLEHRAGCKVSCIPHGCGHRGRVVGQTRPSVSARLNWFYDYITLQSAPAGRPAARRAGCRPYRSG